jgi:hypothetical protein
LQRKEDTLIYICSLPGEGLSWHMTAQWQEQMQKRPLQVIESQAILARLAPFTKSHCCDNELGSLENYKDFWRTWMLRHWLPISQ